MPDRFTREQVQQIKESVARAFEEALTPEEADALGHPNKIKCAICKVGLYAAGGAIIAAALTAGLADIEDDEELIEFLETFAHVTAEVVKEWLKQAQEQNIVTVPKFVHFICKKMKACS